MDGDLQTLRDNWTETGVFRFARIPQPTTTARRDCLAKGQELLEYS
jgi:hypothetical protein